MIVEVTKEDAKNCKCYFSNECLLGTAIVRKFKEQKKKKPVLCVGGDFVVINNKHYSILEHHKIDSCYDLGYGYTHKIKSGFKPFKVTLILEA